MARREELDLATLTHCKTGGLALMLENHEIPVSHVFIEWHDGILIDNFCRGVAPTESIKVALERAP